MKKNVGSQHIAVQMNSRTDGSPLTTSVAVAVTVDNGTSTTGAGTLTHKANGHWDYEPTQGETNGDHVAFQFTHATGVNQVINAYPTFPQTGDNFTRLGAPAGASVSADVAAVKSDTAAVLVDTAEIGAAGAGLTALGDTRIANLDATVGSRATPAQVNTEVLDVVSTDTLTLPGQVAPSNTPTLTAAVGHLYKAWRNKKDNDGSVTQYYADDGTTVDQKQTTSGGSTVTKDEIVSGP
jgi:hypothetical protein